jgi:hypothetical protein
MNPQHEQVRVTIVVEQIQQNGIPYPRSHGAAHFHVNPEDFLRLTEEEIHDQYLEAAFRAARNRWREATAAR